MSKAAGSTPARRLARAVAPAMAALLLAFGWAASGWAASGSGTREAAAATARPDARSPSGRGADAPVAVRAAEPPVDAFRLPRAPVPGPASQPRAAGADGTDPAAQAEAGTPAPPAPRRRDGPRAASAGPGDGRWSPRSATGPPAG
jgi:hypothetical protein